MSWSSVKRFDVELRRARGAKLAKRTGVYRTRHVVGSLWLVPASKQDGGYLVDPTAGTCTCPDAAKHEVSAIRPNTWCTSPPGWP